MQLLPCISAFYTMYILMNIRYFIDRMEWITEAIGRITAAFSLLIMLITFAVVVMRYGFETGYLPLFGYNISSIALQESVIYLHAALFMLASGYTLKHDSHVRVDVFYRNFSVTQKAWVNLFGSLCLLLPVCIFILWTSWDFVTFSWTLKETSQEANGLPWVWVLKTLLPLMATLVLFQGLMEAVKNGLVLLGLTPTQEEQDTGVIL